MALDINNSLGAVKAHVRPVAEEIDARWDMYNIWGFGGSQDHLLGLALDFMLYAKDGGGIRTQDGNEIAAWFVKHSDRLNVSYVIWRQRIWNPSRDPAGASWDNWRRMEDRGDPTQNHMDHVHVSFKPTGVYTPPAGEPVPTPTPVPVPEPVPEPSEDVIYIVKAGDTLGGIATVNNVTVAQLVGWNSIVNADIINVGQRLIVQKGVPPVATDPYANGLPKRDMANPSAKALQTVLKSKGYLANDVALADNYGPKTQAAVAAFYKANPQFNYTGNQIGPGGWAHLRGEAPKPAPTPVPAPSTGEPAHNYTRTTYGGRTVNERTKVMLQAAAKQFGGPFTLTQGSYNRGVSASAGTHDGGGVVDISVGSMTAARRSEAVQCLRKAGFAAWLRTPAQGFAYHIHACAINDREMAQSAKNQVQSYFNGRNGLANNGADTDPPRPWPSWANKYNV